MLQRDIFIKEITNRLKTDKSIFFLSADFGAMALDELREKYPNNFLHCGISEQAMLDIASGLALMDKKVFVYAMAPFISLRAIEQIKCGPGLMDLPICVISTGIGLGYADAGPTHYATEDLSCIRSISGNTIITPSDNNITKYTAISLLNKPKFSYIRLDREPTAEIHKDFTQQDYDNGYKIIGDLRSDKIVLISHGKILQKCVEIAQKAPDKYFCVDLFRCKPISAKLIKNLSVCKKIVCIDEQTSSGNLSSIVFEEFAKTSYNPQIKNVSLPDNYIFENGGRNYLLDKHGLSKIDIEKKCQF